MSNADNRHPRRRPFGTRRAIVLGDTDTADSADMLRDQGRSRPRPVSGRRPPGRGARCGTRRGRVPRSLGDSGRVQDVLGLSAVQAVDIEEAGVESAHVCSAQLLPGNVVEKQSSTRWHGEGVRRPRSGELRTSITGPFVQPTSRDARHIRSQRSRQT